MSTSTHPPAPQGGLVQIASLEELIQQRVAAERARLEKEAGIVHKEVHRFHKPIERPFTADQRPRTTLLFGGLTWKHEKLVHGAIEGLGYKCEVVPTPDVRAFQLGKEYGNNGQCNPTYFTVGNLVQYLQKLEGAHVGRRHHFALVAEAFDGPVHQLLVLPGEAAKQQRGAWTLIGREWPLDGLMETVDFLVDDACFLLQAGALFGHALLYQLFHGTDLHQSDLRCRGMRRSAHLISSLVNHAGCGCRARNRRAHERYTNTLVRADLKPPLGTLFSACDWEPLTAL